MNLHTVKVSADEHGFGNVLLDGTKLQGVRNVTVYAGVEHRPAKVIMEMFALVDLDGIIHNLNCEHKCELPTSEDHPARHFAFSIGRQV